jgi:uncharacterized protein involved in outer membrane biogenesis
MNRIKTIAMIVAGARAALIIVGLVTAHFLLGSAVTRVVNTFGPRITGAPLTLESASISPLTGRGTLHGLFVGNPSGWNSPKAFSVARIDVSLKPFSLLGDTIVINSIVIEQPEFVYETRLVASNIGDLMRAIESSTGGGDAAPADSEDSGSSKRVEIGHFSVEGGSVTLGVGAAALTVPMPPVELNNIGGNDGASPAEATAAMMRSMSTSVITVVTQRTMPAMGEAADGAAKAGAEAARKAGNAIRGLFGGDN